MVPSKRLLKVKRPAKAKVKRPVKVKVKRPVKVKVKPIKKGKTQWDLIYEARNLKTPSLPSLSPKQVIESTDSNVSLSDINIDEIDTGVEEMKYPLSIAQLNCQIK